MALHLVQYLAVFLAETITGLLQRVLTHPARGLVDDTNAALLTYEKKALPTTNMSVSWALLPILNVRILRCRRPRISPTRSNGGRLTQEDAARCYSLASMLTGSLFLTRKCLPHSSLDLKKEFSGMCLFRRRLWPGTMPLAIELWLVSCCRARCQSLPTSLLLEPDIRSWTLSRRILFSLAIISMGTKYSGWVLAHFLGCT